MHINVCVYICIYVHIHVCSEFWNFWTIPIDRATTTTNHMLFVTNPKLQRQTIEHHILLHTTGVEHSIKEKKRESQREFWKKWRESKGMDTLCIPWESNDQIYLIISDFLITLRFSDNDLIVVNYKDNILIVVICKDMLSDIMYVIRFSDNALIVVNYKDTILISVICKDIMSYTCQL